MTEKERAWRKKMKNMLAGGIVALLVGVSLIICGCIFDVDNGGFFGLGAALTFVGIIFIISATGELKRKDAYKKALAMGDERNQKLRCEASQIALALIIVATAIAVMTLKWFDIETIPTMSLQWVYLGGLFLQWLIFTILKHKK